MILVDIGCETNKPPPKSSINTRSATPGGKVGIVTVLLRELLDKTMCELLKSSVISSINSSSGNNNGTSLFCASTKELSAIGFIIVESPLCSPSTESSSASAFSIELKS